MVPLLVVVVNDLVVKIGGGAFVVIGGCAKVV